MDFWYHASNGYLSRQVNRKQQSPFVRDSAVVRFCITRLGIPESDIKKVEQNYIALLYRVTLWNHRRILVTEEMVILDQRTLGLRPEIETLWEKSKFFR